MIETVSVVVLAVLVAAVVIGQAVAGLLARRREPPTLQAREVIVNLTDGTGILGFLVMELPGYLVLRNARHSEQEIETPIDGEAWVPRSRIDWVQAPTGGKP